MKAVRSGAPCKHELLRFLGKGILIRTHMYMYIYIYMYMMYICYIHIFPSCQTLLVPICRVF